MKEKNLEFLKQAMDFGVIQELNFDRRKWLKTKEIGVDRGNFSFLGLLATYLDHQGI